MILAAFYLFKNTLSVQSSGQTAPLVIQNSAFLLAAEVTASVECVQDDIQMSMRSV